jgi:hypothetical protein
MKRCLNPTFLEMNRAAPEESRGGPINYSDAYCSIGS